MRLADKGGIFDIYDPRPIPLNEFDLNPGPCCMSYGFDSKALADSMDAVGLIHPPLVIQDGKGNWLIVSGYRRIHAAQALSWGEVVCRDISDAGLSPLECLLLNLHENLGTRDFNLVEKGMALVRLAPHVSEDDLLNHYMPLLGLPSRLHVLETLTRTTWEFPGDVLKAVASGAFSLAECRLLLDMSPRDRTAVSRILSDVPFNKNQQRQFVELVADICGFSEGSVWRFLEQDSVRSLCTEQRLNGPQRAAALIRLLRQEKFPLLTQARQRFDRAVGGLELRKGTRIRHDPGFESPWYVLEISFTSGEELLQTLREMLGKKGWEKLGDPWEEAPQ